MKRALVFAGIVVVLAACDSATAPSGLSRYDGKAAAGKDTTKKSGSGTQTSTELCGAWVVTSGGQDSVWVDICGGSGQ